MKCLTLIACLAAAAGGIAAADSHGKQVRFVGVHPIPKADGGGICYIEGPHVHIFAADKLQYRDHGGANFFVGDPVAYGYDGNRRIYKGHHPIHVEAVVGDDLPDEEYCYIDGPHFHTFEPPPGPDFKVADGAYFYVGEPPHAYIEARPQYIGINAVYKPLVYERPVIAVAPPEHWIGARVDLPGVVVGGPAVEVRGPAIEVRTPAIVIPTPSIHVDLGVGIGGGVIIERGHHDNGRHEGHHKHR